jgi:hypothetical protein
MQRHPVFHHASTGFVVSTLGLLLLHLIFG